MCVSSPPLLWSSTPITDQLLCPQETPHRCVNRLIHICIWQETLSEISIFSTLGFLNWKGKKSGAAIEAREASLIKPGAPQRKVERFVIRQFSEDVT